MPGGLLSLVCYGNENVLLSGNPQTTWFYKTFMQYTHFSQEPIQIPLEGSDVLSMDTPTVMRAKIPRQGDLLSDLVLRFTLPAIYSKAYISYDPSGNAVLDRAYEFAWVRQIGARLIDTVTFTVGGTKVQEFTSDWICARALLDNDNTTYQKWRHMIGDVPECFDPAQGMYADPSGHGYPHVIAWEGGSQINAPSIPERTIRVPLGLWFSDYIANSLPLVALEYHDCEIQLRMRPMRDLYTIMDPSGVRVRYGYKSLPYLPSDQYTTTWNQSVYGPLPETLNNLYGEYADISGTLKHFLTDIRTSVPTFDGWNLNATLEGTYTYLTPKERQVFARKSLRYNIRQVQNFTVSAVNARATHRLDVHNISSRIVFFARRSDAIPYRNQATNLTNWIYPQSNRRPYAAPLTDYPQIVKINGINQMIGRSGHDLAGLQRNIIRRAFLVANGQQLFDSQDPQYFTEYVPYKYLKGAGMPFNDFGLASQSELWPLYTYSFALNASEIDQPTGTLNTSRINRLELDLDVEDIPPFANYSYEIQIYVETLNYLRITNGMGGLEFAK